MFLFISLLMLFFKWSRLIFILIAFEFLMVSLFIKLVSVVDLLMFFYFMCFSVVSSILGMVIMVGSMKFYGSDMSLY
uniref:NADH dehydrogenase subunit 4L n=1 Tax=Nematodirus oiratianus TaxID=94037 RepID=A0A075CJW5_NEMOI|nr:NADH dehydrogenase subunit 4L [Nematodirus oiratianus]AGZ64204.1 NADH dehydrogenase subunit 4L [Nematodirus oiratianus]